MTINSIQVGYIATNCYLVRNEETNEGFIIDPGMEERKIDEYVDSLHMKPLAILLTHGHFDHIMAVNELKALYPDIKVYAMADEKELLSDPLINCSGKVIRKPYTLNADVYLQDGEVFELAGIELKAILTPGHTAGSGCYYSEKEKVLFSGDTLFYETVGRTDFPTGDSSELIESLKYKLSVLPDETEVYPGHGGVTTIGHEKLYNSYM